MTSQRRYFIAVALLTIAAIAVIAPILIERFVRVDTFKDSILTALQSTLNRPLSYSRGTFSLFPAPCFTFRDIDIRERDGARFASAESVTFKIGILPLLQKKLSLRQVVVDRPVVFLRRDESGKLSIDDILKAPGETPLQLKGLKVQDGSVTFTDKAITPAVTTVVDRWSLSVSRFVRQKPVEISSSGRIGDGRSGGTFSTKGTIRISPEGKPLLDTAVDLKVSIKQVNATPFWGYYAKYVPFNRVDGQFGIDSTMKGTLRTFTSKGEIRIKALRFDYPQVFHTVLAPRDVRADYQLAVDPNAVAVKSLVLTVDGLKVKGACSITDIPSGDPRITADATIAPFRLQEFKQYIPYGIIVKDTSEFIEKYIHDGTYRLLEGRLDGRASQIAHMERGTNFKVLYIRGTVENGLMSFSKTTPTFNGIKGVLELKDTDFILSGMSGRFGSSPFTLDGRIKDYCLEHPSTYPFRMVMTPAQSEARWLFGSHLNLQLAGASSFQMSGDGTSDSFRLAGDWNLAPAVYSAPDIVEKPAGVASSIQFKGTISEKGATATDIRYHLAHLQIAGNGAYRAGNQPHLTVAMRTNRFPLAETARYVPILQKYEPAGTAAVTLAGIGNPDDPKRMNWTGNIGIERGSFVATKSAGRITDVNGTVAISGKTVESSLLFGRIGSSVLYAKGNCSFVDGLALTVSLSSPMIDLADLGYGTVSDHLKWSNVQGNIQYRGDGLNIRSLSGKFNNSTIRMKGKVENLRQPKIDLTIASSNLETSDLVALAVVAQKKSGENSHVSAKATIEADGGKIAKIPFKHLQANAIFESGILYIEPMEVSICGGRLVAKGRFDVGTGGLDRYHASFDLQKASAEQILRALDIEGDLLTGTASVHGDLTARGQGSADIKKTLLGSVKIKSEEGMLRRFSVLSKIFSILNFSQLLKFQLPDMVSGGMPYNHITGTFSFQNGTASTKDLFVDSDAMNISVVGKADLVREELDLTVGVQPLQTIDKVVNRIPIVGWILTGKGKSVITSYFEAKGSWRDPKVSAIPVKAIGKGVFDIFKRVFQLPEKLVTDTGEVIIGK